MEAKTSRLGQRVRSKLRLIGFTAVLAFASVNANALNGDIKVMKCTSCAVASDFVTSAVNSAMSLGRPGTFQVSSDAEARTATVRVTMRQRCGQTEPCYWVVESATGVIVDDAGVVNSTNGQESVLEENDMKLFGTNRKAPLAPINIPSDFGASYINNPSMEPDASSAISRELFINRGISPNSSAVKKDTIVTVVWPDGTTAKFKRSCPTCSQQWTYVPGTARDKNGNRIRDDGSIIGNANSGGRGEGSFSFGGVSGWGGNAFGGDRCMATTQMTWNGVLQWSYTRILPC